MGKFIRDIEYLYSQSNWSLFNLSGAAILFVQYIVILKQYIKALLPEHRYTSESFNYWNILLLFAAPYIIIFSTIYLFTWLHHMKELSIISNYIISTSIFIGISLSFSIISNGLYRYNNETYIIQKDLVSAEVQKRNKNAERVISGLKQEILKLKTVKEDLYNVNELKFLGYVYNSNREGLERAIKNNSYMGSIRNFWFSKYCIYRVSKGTFAMYGQQHEPLPTEWYAPLTERFYIYFNGHWVNINTEYSRLKSLSGSSEEKELRVADINWYKDIIDKKIECIEILDIPTEETIITKNILTLSSFAYFYLLNLVGVNHNFITPFSFSARAIHLFFAVYKFLMLGSFISILLNSVK